MATKQNPALESLLKKTNSKFELQLARIKETLTELNELRSALGLPAIETKIRD